MHEGMSASEMNHNARMPAHRHKRCTHADKAHRTSAERPGPGELCDAFGAKRRRQLGASDLQAARAGHKSCGCRRKRGTEDLFLATAGVEGFGCRLRVWGLGHGAAGPLLQSLSWVVRSL